jgi:hypothetical protein
MLSAAADVATRPMSKQCARPWRSQGEGMLFLPRTSWAHTQLLTSRITIVDTHPTSSKMCSRQGPAREWWHARNDGDSRG